MTRCQFTEEPCDGKLSSTVLETSGFREELAEFNHYEVVFQSQQSYYNLFKAAGISWKKSQRSNPRKDPELVEKKQQIKTWLEAHRPAIETGELVVFIQDECHLLWGDLCGGKLPPETCLGKTSERIQLPINSERQKQTYFGALDYRTKEFLMQAYPTGNTEHTIEFVQYLQSQRQGCRIALIWDGASYHRSHELKAYLEQVNADLDEERWRVTCIRFAPNAPEQNPVEDIWLQAKRFIRECYHLCKSFQAVKVLFELITHRQTFDFPKLHEYGVFSNFI